MSSTTLRKGFLDLPPEIRDTIYEYVVIKDDSVITMLSNAHCFQSEISAAQPAICYVNKQIRQESLATFYKRNIFTAEVSFSDDLQTARNWVFALGDEKVALLRKVLLSSWTRGLNDSSGWHRYHVHAMVNPGEGTYVLKANKYLSGGPEAQVRDGNELEKRFDAFIRKHPNKDGTGCARALAHVMTAFKQFVKSGCEDLTAAHESASNGLGDGETTTIDDS